MNSKSAAAKAAAAKAPSISKAVKKGTIRLDTNKGRLSAVEIDIAKYTAGNKQLAKEAENVHRLASRLGQSVKWIAGNSVTLDRISVLKGMGYDGFVTIDNRKPTDSNDIRFMAYNKSKPDYSNIRKYALTAQERTRFDSVLINPKANAGLTIADNAVLLYNENASKKAKLICYEQFSDGTQITDVYLFDNYDETIHDEFYSMESFVAKGVKHGYSQRTIESVYGYYHKVNGLLL